MFFCWCIPRKQFNDTQQVIFIERKSYILLSLIFGVVVLVRRILLSCFHFTWRMIWIDLASIWNKFKFVVCEFSRGEFTLWKLWIHTFFALVEFHDLGPLWSQLEWIMVGALKLKKESISWVAMSIKVSIWLHRLCLQY